jgi:hypothetical protein
VDRDLYQPPASKISAIPEVRSRRLIHCSIAWVAGFFSLPVLYLALRATGARSVQTPLLERATMKDFIACVIAATVAAVAVVSFRQLPAWLAALAGLVPPVLFLLFAVVVVLYRLTA